MRTLALDPKTQQAIQFVHERFSKNKYYTGTPHVTRMVMLIGPALELSIQKGSAEDKGTFEKFLTYQIQIESICAFYTAFGRETNAEINATGDKGYREFLLKCGCTPEDSLEYHLYKSLYEDPFVAGKKNSAEILRLFSRLRLLDHIQYASEKGMEDYKQDIFFYLDLVEKNFNRMLLTGSPVKCDYDKTKKEFFNVDRRAREKLLDLASNNPMIYMRLTALADQVDSDTAKKLSLFFNHHAMQSEEVFYSALEDIETKSLSVDDWIDRYFSTLNADQGRIFKTIRNDGNCFWNIFADSLVDPKIHRPELRMGERKEFTSRLNTVNNTVVYETVPTEKSLRQHHYGDQKLEYTKPQSTSYANPAAGFAPPYFGQAADRAGLCVGVSFSVKDCILQRIMFYDGGTIDRNYDHNTREKSERYAEDRVREKRWHTSLAGLQEKGLLENKDEINEVMAGFKWNHDGSSHITVFFNNLESRLLAQLRALDLKKRLAKKFPGEKIVVPISIYPDFLMYTDEEQEKDRVEAHANNNDLVFYTQIYDALLENNPVNGIIHIHELDYFKKLIDTFFKINPEKAAIYFLPCIFSRRYLLYAKLLIKNNLLDEFKILCRKCTDPIPQLDLREFLRIVIVENHEELTLFLLSKINELGEVCSHATTKLGTVDFGCRIFDALYATRQLTQEQYWFWLAGFAINRSTVRYMPNGFRRIAEKVPFLKLVTHFREASSDGDRTIILNHFKKMITDDNSKITQKEIDAALNIVIIQNNFEKTCLFVEFLFNLTAENQPSLNVLNAVKKWYAGFIKSSLTQLKQIVIQELIDYIQSRGSIIGGEFQPNFFTSQFRNTESTTWKIRDARALIKKIAGCASEKDISDCLSQEKSEIRTRFDFFTSGYAKKVGIARVKSDCFAANHS